MRAGGVSGMGGGYGKTPRASRAREPPRDVVRGREGTRGEGSEPSPRGHPGDVDGRERGGSKARRDGGRASRVGRRDGGRGDAGAARSSFPSEFECATDADDTTDAHALGRQSRRRRREGGRGSGERLGGARGSRREDVGGVGSSASADDERRRRDGKVGWLVALRAARSFLAERRGRGGRHRAVPLAVSSRRRRAVRGSGTRDKSLSIPSPPRRPSREGKSRISNVPNVECLADTLRGSPSHQNLYLKVFPVRVAISKGSKVTFARVNDPVPVPGTACTGFVVCGISREIAGNGMRGFQPDDSPETRCVK